MRSSKKPNARQLTSTLMAIVMTATTTFQMPNIALASEAESSVAVETAEVTYEEEKTTISAEVDPSGEDTEESDANETRGPDEELTTEIETEAQTDAASEEETETYTEEALIDLSIATKEEILSYIEAIGGDESDAFYAFIGSLGEDDYQLVWMAQYGAEEDQLLENFGFDYDGSSDLDVAKYIHKLSEEELADFVEFMTFEQYRRYISIKEMMAEMDEKDFSDVIDEEEFDADRTWEYASYDAFAEALTGVSLQRTEQVMQFYNTYVDPSKVQAGVTTIDGLLDSNADWYSNDYILGLNPEMFKETVPVYRGSDGNYYVVSTVPTLNGVESADYQPATSFYNGGVEAQAFTDIYLVSASINRGASLPDSVGSMNDGKVLQFVVNDANAVGSLDVLIGYNATSKYSMAAEVTTAELIGSASDDANVNMAAEMYNGAYLKLDQGSVPKNLAVGDKFIYANTALTITGVETSYDLSNTEQHPDSGIHVGAKTIPTHDAQSFCFYNGKGADTDISSWFKTQLNTNSADPGYMVQMTVENMQSRAAWNGDSTTDGKVLNLEGTNVLLSCMHAFVERACF